MARFADSKAREAERERRAAEREPLPEGVDPMDVIDPATREQVLSAGRHEPDPRPDGSIGDRIGGAALGAVLLGLVGVLVVNPPGRGRYVNAAAIGRFDPHATMLAASVGATVGAIAGFARGGNPLGSAAHEAAPAPTRPPAVQSDLAAAAFGDVAGSATRLSQAAPVDVPQPMPRMNFASSLIRSGVHGGLQTSSGSTVSTPGSARTVSTMPWVISGPAGQAGDVSE